MAAAAPELAGALVELGEINARLKNAVNNMLEKINEDELLANFAEAMEYLPEDFGIQEGDMD